MDSQRDAFRQACLESALQTITRSSESMQRNLAIVINVLQQIQDWPQENLQLNEKKGSTND